MYSVKREANYNNWKSARRSLAQTAMALQDPLREAGLCNVDGCENEAVIKCTSCLAAGVMLCCSHDKELHCQAHFHKRKHWQAGFYESLAPHRFLTAVGTSSRTTEDALPSAAESQPAVYSVEGEVTSWTHMLTTDLHLCNATTCSLNIEAVCHCRDSTNNHC